MSDFQARNPIAASRHLVRRTVGMLLVITTTTQGCTRWAQVGLQPEPQGHEVEAVRVVTRDSTVTMVYAPRFTPDSVLGSSVRPDRAGVTPAGSAVAIARSDIQEMSVREPDVAGTLVLLAGVAFVALMILYSMVENSIDYGISM